MMRKKEGAIIDFVTIGIMLLVISILLVMYLNVLNLVNKKANIGQIARKYILKMETVGCLSSSDKSLLLEELMEIGVENVDLTGTTFHMVGYGNDIILCIQGTVVGDELNGANNILTANIIKREYVVKERMKSTSKQ